MSNKTKTLSWILVLLYIFELCGSRGNEVLEQSTFPGRVTTLALKTKHKTRIILMDACPKKQRNYNEYCYCCIYLSYNNYGDNNCETPHGDQTQPHHQSQRAGNLVRRGSKAHICKCYPMAYIMGWLDQTARPFHKLWTPSQSLHVCIQDSIAIPH